MRLSVRLVVIVGWTMVVVGGIVAMRVVVGMVVVRAVALRVVLIDLVGLGLVDPTVVIGHCRVGAVELLETTRVFISSQDTVMSSA